MSIPQIILLSAALIGQPVSPPATPQTSKLRLAPRHIQPDSLFHLQEICVRCPQGGRLQVPPLGVPTGRAALPLGRLRYEPVSHYEFGPEVTHEGRLCRSAGAQTRSGSSADKLTRDPLWC